MVKTSNQVSSSAPFTKSHLVPHVFTSRMVSWWSRGNGTSMNQLWFTSFPWFFIQHNCIYLLHNTLIYIYTCICLYIYMWVCAYIYIQRESERERWYIHISYCFSIRNLDASWDIWQSWILHVHVHSPNCFGNMSHLHWWSMWPMFDGSIHLNLPFCLDIYIYVIDCCL